MNIVFPKYTYLLASLNAGKFHIVATVFRPFGFLFYISQALKDLHFSLSDNLLHKAVIFTF